MEAGKVTEISSGLLHVLEEKDEWTNQASCSFDGVSAVPKLDAEAHHSMHARVEEEEQLKLTDRSLLYMHAHGCQALSRRPQQIIRCCICSVSSMRRDLTY
eukprot:336240-Pelagomonas_calceolata.AAC.1